eukprot:3703127-Prymnesium_polylepis.1
MRRAVREQPLVDGARGAYQHLAHRREPHDAPLASHLLERRLHVPLQSRPRPREPAAVGRNEEVGRLRDAAARVLGRPQAALQ